MERNTEKAAWCCGFFKSVRGIGSRNDARETIVWVLLSRSDTGNRFGPGYGTGRPAEEAAGPARETIVWVLLSRNETGNRFGPGYGTGHPAEEAAGPARYSAEIR